MISLPPKSNNSSPTTHHLLSSLLPTYEFTDMDPTRNFIFANVRGQRELHYPALLNWFKSQRSPPPVAIISDCLLGWTNHLANEIGVPRLLFSPCGACPVAVINSLWRDLPKRDNPDDVEFPITISRVPNSQTYPWWQIPDPYEDYKEGDPDSEFFRSSELGNVESWGVVINSFTQMEGDYIDYLKGEYGPDRVWAVGPLKLLEDEGSGGGSSSTPARHDVMTWLDQRRDGSVVFVCFGSWVSLTENTVNVIAAGLERSGVDFVWRVGDNDVVPSDFEERVGCRGYVTKGWAPQMQNLRHRALASFLTHCGWNSAVEATSVGAPMLTWPITGDQFITAKLLVDHLGVAFRAGEGNRVVPEPDKLAQILRESLDNTHPEIVRVKKLSDAAFVAIKGGSSNRDLDDLATRLVELQK